MGYNIAIYDWSLYTLPSALSTANIEGATYGHGTPSWLGETFTFNGGASTLLSIDDDDDDFEDAYVETGGAQTLAQDVTINGVDYFAGDVVENEFSMLDASGNEIWVVRINGVNVGFSYPSGEDPTAGDDFVGDVGRDGDPADSQDGVGSSEPYNAIICFAPGALIETPEGSRPVETLRVGDLVTTIDRGPVPVRWVSRRQVVFCNGLEDAKPIQIKAGAFAQGYPDDDIVVSPQHRFVMHDHRSQTDKEVFVPAKSLTRLPGVRVMRGKKSVEYIHFALDRHEVVIANGVYTESCFLGPVMLDDTPIRERATLKSIFPDVEFDPGRGYGPTARPVIKMQEARNLIKSSQLAFRAAEPSGPNKVARC
jgi:hypothetical protein